MDESLPSFLFDPKSWIEQFGRKSECYLEIGFGGGEHLSALAKPGQIVIYWCEPYMNGVASLLRHITQQSLTIFAFGRMTRDLFSAAKADFFGRSIYFVSDPWPKTRHAARRILQPELLAQLAESIQPGGQLVLASDDSIAKTWILQALIGHSAFSWTACSAIDWRCRPANILETRYLQKAELAGRIPSWFVFNRRNENFESES